MHFLNKFDVRQNLYLACRFSLKMLLLNNKFLFRNTTMSVTLVTSPTIVKRLFSMTFQSPLNKIVSHILKENSHSSLLQAPNRILNEQKTSSLLSMFRKFIERIDQHPITKRVLKNVGKKKSVILIPASAFLGYHKDGKVSFILNY